MFLNDGRVVFTLFIILFRFSRFVCCSCDSVSVGLLGTVAYSFSRVGSSFLICCCFFFFFFGWCYLMCLELYYFASVFSGIFLVFQGQKTILFNYCSILIGRPLACSLKTSIFLPGLYHSFPIASLNSQHSQDDYQISHVGYQENTCRS